MTPVKTVVGTTLLLVLALAPIVPQDMTFKYAYEHHYFASRQRNVFHPATASTTAYTETITEPDTEQFPDDGTGKVFVAVFVDSKGSLVYIKIDETRYRKMGFKGGATFNPTKNEYKSLFNYLVTPAFVSAAIVRDSMASSSATASSLTFAHTNTGSNMLLLVGGVSINDQAEVVTGITYNGTSMTRWNSIGYGGVARSMVYYQLAPSTGTNNVVVSSSDGSYTLQFQSVSYTGVDTSSNPESGTASTTSSTSGTNLNHTITTVADNALHIAYYRVDSTNPNSTTGLFVGGPTNSSREGFYTSNPATVSPAGSNTINVGTVANNWTAIGGSFAPGSAAPPSVSIDPMGWFLFFFFP